MTTKHKVRRVRADFDKTKEYSVNVADCTVEEKEAVQQAFFDAGIFWNDDEPAYRFLNATQYSNTWEHGGIGSCFLFSAMSDECNMTAKQFLQLVYEPTEQEYVHTELKNKKLIDILIDNDIQWPEDADGVVQDCDGEVKFYTGEKLRMLSGVWMRDRDNSYADLHLQIASDYNTAVITKADWENRKVDKKPMFDGIKVGDKVWDICEGWGVVSELLEGHDYPICVEFEYVDSTYTRDGYYDLKHVNPSLFWDEIEVKAPPKPLPDLEVDTKVFVWDSLGTKLCRHFSHFDEDGVLHAFKGGKSSFTGSGAAYPWSNWEIAE